MANPLSEGDGLRQFKHETECIKLEALYLIQISSMTLIEEHDKCVQQQKKLAMKFLEHQGIPTREREYERAKMHLAINEVPFMLRLRALLHANLVQQFGTPFMYMVLYVGDYILMQIITTDQQHSEQLPVASDEEILKDIVDEFELAIPVASSAEDVLTELATKFALAFAEAFPGAKVTLLERVENISLTN